jgi:hypothetical protein
VRGRDDADTVIDLNPLEETKNAYGTAGKAARVVKVIELSYPE